MRKVLCSPITKVLLILPGYISLLSAFGGVSRSFHALFINVFGTWFRFGFIPSALLFLLCVGGLVWSVAMTKNSRLRQERIFILWRKADGLLYIIFSIWLAAFFLFRSWEMGSVWFQTGAIFPFTLAYLIGIVAVMELTARIRDKEFLNSFCWVAFFRKYPIWKPLGFMMVLLLTANLLFFLFLSPMAGLLFNIRFWLLMGFPHAAWFSIELESVFQISSALTLVGLTFFVTVLLNLSARQDEANAEKIRLERFKSELITNVSHDIRTPLTSIINYVDLLKSEPLEGKSVEYLSVLEKKSARLKTLIDDLMDASKAGTGNVSVTLKDVDLTELVGQVAGEFDEQFNARDLTLVLRQPDESVFAHADSRHLWRTLENLFSNAAKYALSSTRVFAELSLREGNAVFALKNVSQMPIDLSGDALTEQFIRGDRARESEGSGLGLYIAKSLVELMGGQFAIRTSGDLFEVEVVFVEYAASVPQ